jgi:ABC-2 type transport system permease protein
MALKTKIRRNFREFNNELRGIRAIYVKAWKILKRYPLSLAFFIFAPLLWLLPHLIYGTAVAGGRYSPTLEALIGFGDVLVYTGLGLVIMAFINRTVWSTSYSLREEEFLGTLENMYITPISRFSIILGNSLFSISQVLVGCTIQIVIIAIWYREAFHIVNLLLATLFILLGVIMVQGIAMVFVSFVFWQKEGWRFILVILSLVYLITPYAFPIVVLPNFLQGLASVNPLTFAIEGFRKAFLYGYSFEIVRYLVILIILVPVVLILGALIFRITEKMLRKKALLGQY